MKTSNSWFLVMSKPKMEVAAKENLIDQGYEVYLPGWYSLKKKGGGWLTVKSPMFPRYIFVRPHSSEQSITPVRSTRGVSHLVKFGIHPAVTSDLLITQIHHLEQRSKVCSSMQAPFDHGDSVRILDGPFSGVSAKVMSCNHQRVILLLQILGQEQQLELKSTSCIKYGDSQI